MKQAFAWLIRANRMESGLTRFSALIVILVALAVIEVILIWNPW
jgi:hypothetical protein